MTKQLADELTALAEKATRVGWTDDQWGNLAIGMKPLFKRTGASAYDVALVLALRNNLTEIIAALSDRSDGWRDIESAPKNGTPLLLFARCKTATAPVVLVGWHDFDWGWIESSFTSPVGIVPLAWQPRPTPPEATT